MHCMQRGVATKKLSVRLSKRVEIVCALGLQLRTCSGYDCATIHMQRQIDRQADIQTAFDRLYY